MVRPDFSDLMPPADARDHMLKYIQPSDETEHIPTEQALGRVTVAAITSPRTVPDFRRSAMDGYAVRAADVAGGRPERPAMLRVIGEVPMGALADFEIGPDEAAVIHTGGHVPAGADAVVRVEDTSEEGEMVAVFDPPDRDANIIPIGSDITTGDQILPAGHILRTQDVGGLLAVGITEIEVVRQPRVVIFTTGDEIIPPSQEPQPGQIRDINNTTVSKLTEQAGAVAINGGILPDDYDTILSRVQQALDEGADMIVVSAGSSMSERDVTVQVFRAVGEVFVHGINTRPGKPTILGAAGNTPLIGLPGNPVSAYTQFLLMGTPVLYRLLGTQTPRSLTVRATVDEDIGSVEGREDYYPVRLTDGPDGLVATPIPFSSNLIFTLVKADGLINVPAERTALVPGDEAEVRLFLRLA